MEFRHDHHNAVIGRVLEKDTNYSPRPEPMTDEHPPSSTLKVALSIEINKVCFEGLGLLKAIQPRDLT